MRANRFTKAWSHLKVYFARHSAGDVDGTWRIVYRAVEGLCVLGNCCSPQILLSSLPLTDLDE